MRTEALHFNYKTVRSQSQAGRTIRVNRKLYIQQRVEGAVCIGTGRIELYGIYGILRNYLSINTASVHIIKINKLQTGNGR